MLTLSDLNSIVKFYAYRIQQRIQQLEHLNFSFNLQQDPEADNQEYQFITIISKYHLYTTVDEKQVKLAKKLVERILQIYQFFKMKSNNQNLLQLIQQKIQSQIKQIITQNPINLGELFTYVHFMTKKGCVIRVPAEKKRTASKSIIKQSYKNQGKIALSFFNARKAISMVSSQKQNLKAPIIINQKWRIQEAIAGLWSGLEIDRYHLIKIRDSNQGLSIKQMMKRNQKIAQTINKNDRRCKKTTTQGSLVDESKQSVILTELKTNSIKAIWFLKKRRPILSSKKRNRIFKQNISTVC